MPARAVDASIDITFLDNDSQRSL